MVMVFLSLKLIGGILYNFFDRSYNVICLSGTVVARQFTGVEVTGNGRVVFSVIIAVLVPVLCGAMAQFCCVADGCSIGLVVSELLWLSLA